MEIGNDVVDFGFEGVETFLLNMFFVWWWVPVMSCIMNVMVSAIVGGSVHDAVFGIRMMFFLLGMISACCMLVIGCVLLCWRIGRSRSRVNVLGGDRAQEMTVVEV